MMTTMGMVMQMKFRYLWSCDSGYVQNDLDCDDNSSVSPIANELEFWSDEDVMD